MEKIIVFYYYGKPSGFEIDGKLYGFSYSHGDVSQQVKHINEKVAKAILTIFQSFNFMEENYFDNFKHLLALVDVL